MKKKLIYSESKFRSFTVDKQFRILLEILKAIELSRKDENRFQELKVSYANCLGFIDEETGELEDYRIISTLIDDERKFSLSLANLRNKLNDRFKEKELHIYTKDKVDTSYKEIPMVVILDNLRSTFNVGSIFRTTECVKARKIFCCGITPTPEMKDVQETSMNTAEHVDWEYYAETSMVIEMLKKKGYTILALETAEPSIDLYEYTPHKAIALVMGNEALGLTPEILNQCDCVIRIPVRGWKNSLNVGVSYAVAAYEMLRKFEEVTDD